MLLCFTKTIQYIYKHITTTNQVIRLPITTLYWSFVFVCTYHTTLYIQSYHCSKSGDQITHYYLALIICFVCTYHTTLYIQSYHCRISGDQITHYYLTLIICFCVCIPYKTTYTIPYHIIPYNTTIQYYIHNYFTTTYQVTS